MKNFITVLKFEFLNYMRNKTFIILTLILVVLVGGGLTIPRFLGSFQSDTDVESGKSLIAVSGVSDESTLDVFRTAMPDSEFILADFPESKLNKDITDEKYDSAIIITGELSYKYIVKNIELYDTTSSAVDEVIKTLYQTQKLSELGASAQDISNFMSASVNGEVVQVEGGKDQTQNFFYTYILIMALYMAIILYGQFVATSTATEKSNRAMELLITSSKPSSLMFGKIIGTGCAGLLQFVLVFGSGYLFYHINSSFYADNPIVQSIFNMPADILIYALIFFVLGFAIYSFMYGALGSLVSRIEQLNTAIMPITFLFVIAFVVVITALSSGDVDSGLIRVASFIPFTSPIAMFVRIALGSVSTLEIIISIAVLLLSTVGVGYLSAMIYRVGVLMYGQPPKIKDLISILKQSKDI